MTPKQGAARLEAMAKRLETGVKAAELKTIREGKRIAVKLSSGPHKQSFLTKIGHPYAQRHMTTAFDPSIINKQTGTFRAAWFAFSSEKNGYIYSAIVNPTWYASYLDKGTRKMVKRPLRQEVIKEMLPVRWQNLHRAVGKALTP